MKDLCVVVPVYNESEVIEFVIDEWSNHLKDLKIDFELVAYNDGSNDNTLEKLNDIKNHKELK